ADRRGLGFQRGLQVPRCDRRMESYQVLRHRAAHVTTRTCVPMTLASSDHVTSERVLAEERAIELHLQRIERHTARSVFDQQDKVGSCGVEEGGGSTGP